MEDVARYLITDGNKITIEPYEGADEDSIRLFLLGTAFGALMHQRETLILHGSVVTVGNGCVAFLGVSGAGKSTLAAAFHKRGRGIVADDYFIVEQDEKGQQTAHPSYPQLKLWEDSMKKLGYDHEGYRRVRPDLNKYAFPFSEAFAASSLPIKCIYLLSVVNSKVLKVEDIVGLKKFELLRANTYRLRFIQGLDISVPLFKNCSVLAETTPVKQVSRPRGHFLLDELTNLLEADFAQWEK